MIERRQYPRHALRSPVQLTHPEFGRIDGQLKDMSEGGIFVEVDNPHSFKLNTWLEGRITGRGWDRTLPALAMMVVRIQASGIALQYKEAISLPFLDQQENEEEQQLAEWLQQA